MDYQLLRDEDVSPLMSILTDLTYIKITLEDRDGDEVLEIRLFGLFETIIHI